MLTWLHRKSPDREDRGLDGYAVDMYIPIAHNFLPLKGKSNLSVFL